MKQRTISEIYVEVDKMSWLRIRWEGSNWQEILSIRWWDEKKEIVVRWGFYWDNIELLPTSFISNEFVPFDELWNPIPYAQRSWSLWKPKTVWSVRLSTIDWINFFVNLHNRNWDKVANLWKWSIQELKELMVNTDYWEKNFLLFDPSRHTKKIEKILLQNK